MGGSTGVTRMAGSGCSSYWGRVRCQPAKAARVVRRDTKRRATNSTVNKITDARGENTAADPLASTPETAPPDSSAVPSAQMALSILKKEGS